VPPGTLGLHTLRRLARLKQGCGVGIEIDAEYVAIARHRLAEAAAAA